MVTFEVALRGTDPRPGTHRVNIHKSYSKVLEASELCALFLPEVTLGESRSELGRAKPFWKQTLFHGDIKGIPNRSASEVCFSNEILASGCSIQVLFSVSETTILVLSKPQSPG